MPSTVVRRTILATGLLVCGCSAPTDTTPAERPARALKIDRRWTREGYGEAWQLAAVDLDGDGSDEVLYGGRGLAALDRRSLAIHRPRWETPWPKGSNLDEGGDNEWVAALGSVSLPGDSIPDAIIMDASRHAYAVDGATGAIVWSQNIDAPLFAPWTFTQFDADGDGVLDFYPNGATGPYSGATGEQLWSLNLPEPPIAIVRAELDGRPGEDLLLVRQMDSIVGTGESSASSVEETVYAVTATGTLLWSQTTESGPIAATAADLDGDGIAEAVVATQDSVVALDAAGARWMVPVFAPSLLAADVDGDGRDEVIAGEPLGVRLIDGAGETLWSEVPGAEVGALHLAELDGDAAPELVVGSGGPLSGVDADAVAYDLDRSARDHTLWRYRMHDPPSAVAEGVLDGRKILWMAGNARALEGVDANTGEAIAHWVAGGFVNQVAGADLDGDGSDEVIQGDDAGFVVASDGATGDERWAVRLDVGEGGIVSGLATGDVDGAGAADVVVTGWRFDLAEGGVLARIHDGAVVFSHRSVNPLFEARLVDLDGDGVLETITGETSPDMCGVTAWNADGTVRWRTQFEACMTLAIAVGDVDGDGVPEIAYGDDKVYGPWRVALLGHDGSVRWSKALDDRTTTWVAIVPGGVVQGGFHVEPEGHVTFRAARDGAERWSYRPRTLPDPEAPGESIPGGVEHGLVLPGDVTQDSPFDVVVTTTPGDVVRIDGTTGRAVWQIRTEREDAGMGKRHVGGPLTYVPKRGDEPPWLALAESSLSRGRSKVYRYTLGGDRIASFPMDGWGTAAATTQFGAVIGAGLGVHALGTSP